MIAKYPKLEKIVVEKSSLNLMTNLKICDNDQLKSIEIKDGERDKNYGSLQSVSLVFIGRK